MPCYHPMTGYRGKTPGPSGKASLVFQISRSTGEAITVPCGKCIGCRLEKSRQWSIRCIHEAQMHKENCFLTLTYNDENLPSDLSLQKIHFQKFMKRLRKSTSKKIRFYMCGEYGDINLRPHYHACIFGYDFKDKKYYKKTAQDHILWVSEKLQKLWPYGFCTIGELTEDTAAYTARYIMKKIGGKQAKEHYESIDKETGEITKRIPEYATMSLKPGIGKTWYDKFKSDLYPDDFVVTSKGKKAKIPNYYDKLLEREDPELLEKLKLQRIEEANLRADDQTPERRNTREKVKLSLIKTLQRTI